MLSLIIPMFNAKLTIGLTLKSLLAAKSPQFEIILIDDGSTDGGAEYVGVNFSSALADRSLVLLQQTNQGVSAARNVGIDRAQGDYIGFVDSDDIVEEAYLCTLLTEIASRPHDIIEFGYRIWHGQVDQLFSAKAQYVNPHFGFFERSQIERGVFGLSRWYPWARIFHRRLFQQTRFPVGIVFCEDLMTISKLYLLASTTTSLSAVLYRYRQNSAGTTLNSRPEYVTKLTAFYLSILNLDDDCSILLKTSIQFCIYSCQHNMDIPYKIDPRIECDLRKIRFNSVIFRFLPIRRIRILWFPAFNRFLANTCGTKNLTGT